MNQGRLHSQIVILCALCWWALMSLLGARQVPADPIERQPPVTIEIDIDANGTVIVAPNSTFVKEGDRVEWHVKTNHIPDGGRLTLLLPGTPGSPFGNPLDIATGITNRARIDVLEIPALISWQPPITQYLYRVDFSLGGAVVSSATARLRKREFEEGVPAGFDMFQTVPVAGPCSTHFLFADEFAIPDGFFGPGSRPFTGVVRLQGVPLGTFAGFHTGTADTIIERKEASHLPRPFPSRAIVPIELVALSLKSTDPIAVQVGTISELWDVEVEVSPSRPSTGEMLIAKYDENGGEFYSEFVVYPLFRFTRDRTVAVRSSVVSV